MVAGTYAYRGQHMAKKPKATLYVDIDVALKARLDKIAETNGRKLVAEVSRALEFYLAAHEPKTDDAPAKKTPRKPPTGQEG